MAPAHAFSLALAEPGRGLAGTVRVPGDKSISHRALMLAGLAVGESRISGLLEGEDVLATAAAMRALGCVVERAQTGVWHVHGAGVGSLLQPEAALDLGNSGTSARLLMGVIASHPLRATLVGDASLSRRPMERVMAPLRAMGADFLASPGGRLPLTITGLAPAIPLRWRLDIPSAQVKTAILLAGLNADGRTTVEEPVPTRDHGERMLAAFGAGIAVETVDGMRLISVEGPADLRPQTLEVPGDPSSAAFPAVAASIVPGSDILIRGVGLNPTRDGLYRILEAMGARIERLNPRTVGGEPVADLRIEAAPLSGLEVPPDIAPAMIDEYPALFVAAAFAEGRTVMRGIGELRVKESDRIAAMAAGLSAAGVMVEELADGLIVEGSGGAPVTGGATVAAQLDHRIAMSLALLSLHARAPVVVDDGRPIGTSFPGFAAAMQAIGCRTVSGGAGT
jgi:3-phosphoshikimate 1-carboxyvinyltransferase